MARVLAVVSWSGNTSTHLVNRSVITNIYLLPVDDVGSGPVISQDNLSKGHVASIVSSGTGEFGWGRLRLVSFTLLDPTLYIFFISWPIKMAFLLSQMFS